MDKNGDSVPGQSFKGNDVILNSISNGKHLTSTGSGVVYLNGDGDYVILRGYITGTGTIEINTGTTLTGHLITGQSSGGGTGTTTATMYTAEETETAIDKKLAIKDKLIEKLSDRLDKLEKKLKK